MKKSRIIKNLASVMVAISIFGCIGIVTQNYDVYAYDDVQDELSDVVVPVQLIFMKEALQMSGISGEYTDMYFDNLANKEMLTFTTNVDNGSGNDLDNSREVLVDVAVSTQMNGMKTMLKTVGVKGEATEKCLDSVMKQQTQMVKEALKLNKE